MSAGMAGTYSNTLVDQGWVVAQLVMCLPNMHKTLGSDPSAPDTVYGSAGL